MLGVIKEMIQSKKFIAAVAAVIVAAAMKIGLELPEESVLAIVSPLIAYIIGQGWADSGKEAAKIKQNQ